MILAKSPIDEKVSMISFTVSKIVFATSTKLKMDSKIASKIHSTASTTSRMSSIIPLI